MWLLLVCCWFLLVCCWFVVGWFISRMEMREMAGERRRASVRAKTSGLLRDARPRPKSCLEDPLSILIYRLFSHPYRILYMEQNSVDPSLVCNFVPFPPILLYDTVLLSVLNLESRTCVGGWGFHDASGPKFRPTVGVTA